MTRAKQTQKSVDTEVVAEILAGATDLYEVLMRRYNAYLYRVGRSYGYEHEDTEDLMQETYIDAFTNLAKFEKRASFKTWLTRIMINNCFQKREKFGHRKEVPTEFKPSKEYEQMFTNKEKEADRMVFAKELNRIIENALQEIPLDYRIVFALRELNGFSVRQTSEALAISENNVKVRLSRARKMLRRHIEKMYAPEDIYEFDLVYCDRLVERVLAAITRLENDRNRSI